jgi:glycogen phosphorylase
VDWVIESFLTEMPQRAVVVVEGRTVRLRAWKYEAAGSGGYEVVAVYFLDTDLPDNSDWDRTITHFLYGGDQYYRLVRKLSSASVG